VQTLRCGKDWKGMASQAAEKLNFPGKHAFKTLKARLIPALYLSK